MAKPWSKRKTIVVGWTVVIASVGIGETTRFLIRRSDEPRHFTQLARDAAIAVLIACAVGIVIAGIVWLLNHRDDPRRTKPPSDAS
jgi:beta-lactamase regulating signal transducer with metallopeptidase domain